MQSPPSLYIPQFQLSELFVCFGRPNRILTENGHGDFSVHSIMDKPLLLLTLYILRKGNRIIWTCMWSFWMVRWWIHCVKKAFSRSIHINLIFNKEHNIYTYYIFWKKGSPYENSSEFMSRSFYVLKILNAAKLSSSFSACCL